MKKNLSIKRLAALCLVNLLPICAVAQNTQEKVELDSLYTTTKQTPSAISADLGKFGNISLSGYVQAQWQWAESKGISAIAQGGSFPSESNNRFMVRRGRVKFTYSLGFAKMVIQPDISEKGLKVRDVYINATSYNKLIGGQIGAFDRPFGYEISYSSSQRESPERSRIYNSLLPGEREVGAMLKMNYKGLSLDAGLFNGNGLSIDNDSTKDFIGRLSYAHKLKNGVIGAEVSLYEGTIYNMGTYYFDFVEDEGFVAQTAGSDKNYLRQYFGVGVHYCQNWWAGETKIYGEYLWGTQPGTLLLNYNIVGDDEIIEETNPLYIRQFRGGYLSLAQKIGKTKHGIILKYDYYDPNTEVKGDQIGKLQNTGIADFAYTTYGVGYIYNCTDYLKLTAYYDFVVNETSGSYASFKTQRQEDVFTLRVQFKF